MPNHGVELKNACGLTCYRGFSATIAVSLPHFPRGNTARTQAFQLLLVLECVHTRPEPIIRVANQLLFFDQPVERLDYEFLFLTDVIENLLLENEKASVDPNRAIVNGMDPRDEAAVALLQGHQMIAEVRSDTEEAGNFVMLVEMFQLVRKLEVGQTITVIGEEFFFSLEVLLYSP